MKIEFHSSDIHVHWTYLYHVRIDDVENQKIALIFISNNYTTINEIKLKPLTEMVNLNKQ